MDPNSRLLAAKYGTQVIELQNADAPDITMNDGEQLVETIVEKMGGRP